MIRTSLRLVAALVVGTPVLRAQTYERIDVGNAGQLGNSSASHGEISDDGRFVAFASGATNLGASFASVYLRDRVLDTTLTLPLGPTPGAYRNPRISRDGGKVTFSGSSGLARAFIHDRVSGITSEITVPGLFNLEITALDRDGTYAALSARTTPAGQDQIFRLHIPSGAFVLCSRSTTGAPVGGANADIDALGRLVVFTSAANSIVPNDTDGSSDVFAYDVPGDVMLRASVATTGDQANALHDVTSSVDADGRFVAFASNATNLVPFDFNNRQDVFVRDLRSETTTLVSLDSAQAQLSQGTTGQLQISGDASAVAFASDESIAPLDLPLTRSLDVFARDLVGGSLLNVSTGSSSSAPTNVRALGFTYDGREMLFASEQPGMTQSSAIVGIFVATYGPRCNASGYCTSLPNSTGAAATIGAQGDASRAQNSLVIAGLDMPNDAVALLVSGTSAIDPGLSFGNGLLCVGGVLVRHGIHIARSGVILDAQDVFSAEYTGVLPGDTRFFQIFYRDPAAGGAQFNTSDAVAVTFCW